MQHLTLVKIIDKVPIRESAVIVQVHEDSAICQEAAVDQGLSTPTYNFRTVVDANQLIYVDSTKLFSCVENQDKELAGIEKGDVEEVGVGLIDSLGIYESSFDYDFPFELIFTSTYSFNSFLTRALFCLDVVPSNNELRSAILHDHYRML